MAAGSAADRTRGRVTGPAYPSRARPATLPRLMPAPKSPASEAVTAVLAALRRKGVDAHPFDPAATPLAEVMTPNPQTIPAEKPFCHALHIMFDGGFRHLPVVNELGQPIGIVSVRDALGLEMIQFGHEMEQRDTLTEIL